MYPIQISWVKILCVLYLHYNVAFTFKRYGYSWNKKFYSQRVWIGYNIELAELVYSLTLESVSKFAEGQKNSHVAPHKLIKLEIDRKYYSLSPHVAIHNAVSVANKFKHFSLLLIPLMNFPSYEELWEAAVFTGYRIRLWCHLKVRQSNYKLVPINANPRLNFNPNWFFFCSKNNFPDNLFPFVEHFWSIQSSNCRQKG